MQIFCKNMFHKKFFLRRRSSKKKKSRQYLLSVAFCERSLLIVREICFFKSIFWKLTYSRFKRRNYVPFMNFLFWNDGSKKNPPNFKRFLPSFPIAQFTFDLAGSCLHFSHFWLFFSFGARRKLHYYCQRIWKVLKLCKCHAKGSTIYLCPAEFLKSLHNLSKK